MKTHFLGFLILAASAIVAHSQQQPQVNVYNVEAPGNLKGQLAFTGKTLAEIKPAHTPPDLAQRANELFAIDRAASLQIATAAQLLAYFDASRVSDRTAQGAWDALTEKFELSRVMSWGFCHPDEYLKAIRDTVAWAEKTPPPTYHPSWMIQHGLGAFTDEVKNQGLVQPFDASGSWASEAQKLTGFAEQEEIWDQCRQLVTPAAAAKSVDDLINEALGMATQLGLSESEQKTYNETVRSQRAKLDVTKGDIGTQVFEIKESIRSYIMSQINRRAAQP